VDLSQIDKKYARIGAKHNFDQTKYTTHPSKQKPPSFDTAFIENFVAIKYRSDI
jgi:hypothetical protein